MQKESKQIGPVAYLVCVMAVATGCAGLAGGVVLADYAFDGNVEGEMNSIWSAESIVVFAAAGVGWSMCFVALRMAQRPDVAECLERNAGSTRR